MILFVVALVVIGKTVLVKSLYFERVGIAARRTPRWRSETCHANRRLDVVLRDIGGRNPRRDAQVRIDVGRSGLASTSGFERNSAFRRDRDWRRSMLRSTAGAKKYDQARNCCKGLSAAARFHRPAPCEQKKHPILRQLFRLSSEGERRRNCPVQAVLTPGC